MLSCGACDTTEAIKMTDMLEVVEGLVTERAAYAAEEFVPTRSPIVVKAPERAHRATGVIRLGGLTSKHSLMTPGVLVARDGTLGIVDTEQAG